MNADMLTQASRIVETIESMPLDAPDLGAVLGAVEHAIERKQAVLARRVVDRARAVAAAVGGDGAHAGRLRAPRGARS